MTVRMLCLAQAAGAHMGYPGAVHPDGTPVNMPDGMLARTLAWDSPGDGQAIGPDGKTTLTRICLALLLLQSLDVDDPHNPQLW